MKNNSPLKRANKIGVSPNNVISIGKVIALDEADAKKLAKPNEKLPKFKGDVPRVLVQIGGEELGSYTLNWIPWVLQRAGFDSEWWAPELEEQVLVACISGNPALGVIIGSLYRGQKLQYELANTGANSQRLKILKQHPEPKADRDMWQRLYADGSSLTYNRFLHQLAIDIRDNKAPVRKGASITDQEREKAAKEARGKDAALFQSSITKNECEIHLREESKSKNPNTEITFGPTHWHQLWRSSGDQKESIVEKKISIKDKSAKLSSKIAESKNKGVFIDASSDGVLTINATDKATIIIGDKKKPKLKITYDAGSGGDFEIESKQNITIKAAKTLNISASNLKIKGKTEIDGNVTVKGKTTLNRGAAINGKVNINGNLDIK